MKILLIGFYGEGNLGDEAILEAILANLPNHVRPIVTLGKEKTRAGSIRSIKAIKRRGAFSLPIFIKNAAQCEHAIFSGGILQDWSLDGVLFFALRIFAAAAVGCRVSLWGAGLGPLRHIATRKIAATALRCVDKAWVRDEFSAALYRELTSREAKCGADWSWHFKVPERLVGADKIEIVNLRPWAHKLEELEELKLANDLVDISGIAARREDIGAITNVFGKIEIKEPASFSELLQLCALAEKGVAMRYHVALAMLRCGVRFRAIAYDEKVREVQKGLLRREFYIEESERLYRGMCAAFLREFTH